MKLTHERLLEEIELDGGGVKGVVTPGQQPQQYQIADEKELPEEQHTRFRGLAARANFLAADRIDIIYAAGEICRVIAKPTDLAWAALKRFARYLKAKPRIVFPCVSRSAKPSTYTGTHTGRAAFAPASPRRVAV